MEKTVLKRSSLLTGGSSEYLMSRAKEMAAEILETSVDRLYLHPDFLMIQSQDGKKSIVLDDILPIFELANLVPMGDYFTVIIDGMDRLTLQAANKMLKILEDKSSLIVLGICYGQVLPTIKSRMQCLNIKPKSAKEYDGLGDDAGLYFDALRGRIGKTGSEQ